MAATDKDLGWLGSLAVGNEPGVSAPVRAADVSHNWSAMFIAYSRGLSFAEISEMFGVEERVLERVARKQQWEELNLKLQAHPIEDESVLAHRLQAVEDNRQRNLEAAEDFRDTLIQQARLAATGDLEIEHVVKFKEGYDIAKTKAAPKDLKALADSLRTMADMSYRALGDDPDRARAGGNDKGPKEQQNIINVIIPQAVSPEQYVPESEVIENP